jgi:carbon-monoxide dehydrogenase medium subunit
MTTFYRRLPRFDYVQPTSLDEALSLLGRYKADAKPLAGGTDLIPQVKGRDMAAPRVVVDLKAIPGLDAITYDATKGLTLGAMATIANVERSALVREHYPMLSNALTTMASPQVRNRATVTANAARPGGCAEVGQSKRGAACSHHTVFYRAAPDRAHL